jgi:prophage DNA circulation protein
MKAIMIMLVSIFLVSTTNNYAQIPTCPIRVGNTELYSSTSLLGDKICPLLNTGSAMLNGLGSNVEAKLNELRTDMERFKRVSLEDAINEDAVNSYNNSILQLKSISTELTNYLRDAECGVPGAMDALKNKFLQSVKTITDIASIATSFGNAFAKLGPVVPEAITIGNKVMEISASVNNQTPEMKKQFDILKNAIDAIKRDIEKLMKNDPIRLVETGSTIVTGLVPYLGECAACATALSTSLTGLGTAAGGTSGGVATSETGVGAAVGGSAAVVGSIAAATSSALSAVPCQAVYDKSGEVKTYVEDIKNFVNAIANTTVSISNNAEKIIEENKPRLAVIKTSLTNIANTFIDVATELERDVAKKIGMLVGDKVNQIAIDVNQLLVCYDKLGTTFGYMTENLKEGILDFVPAVAQMVDAERVIDNITNQFANAKTSAETSLRNNWKSLNDSRIAFSVALLGSQPNDLGRVAAHFLTLGGKIDDLARTGSNLSSSIANLVLNAANAGKQGFLTSINANKSTAQSNYAAVKEKAKALAIAIAKAKAKSKIEANARALKIQNSKANISKIVPSTKLVPLSSVMQLKAQLAK